VGYTEVGFRKIDSIELTVQEPHTINKLRIAVLSAILLGVQKDRLVAEVGIIKRILIPNLKL